MEASAQSKTIRCFCNSISDERAEPCAKRSGWASDLILALFLTMHLTCDTMPTTLSWACNFSSLLLSTIVQGHWPRNGKSHFLVENDHLFFLKEHFFKTFLKLDLNTLMPFLLSPCFSDLIESNIVFSLVIQYRSAYHWESLLNVKDPSSSQWVNHVPCLALK